ncbi:MAG: hypothetical protein LBD23_16475, partial [Oscillospiraceae bacterium]|nr:hypothetical protein [Oscillospiraceae bacterium]
MKLFSKRGSRESVIKPTSRNRNSNKAVRKPVNKAQGSRVINRKDVRESDFARSAKPDTKNNTKHSAIRNQIIIICSLLLVLTATVYGAWHLELFGNPANSPDQQTIPSDENPNDHNTISDDPHNPDDPPDSIDDIPDPIQDTPTIAADMTSVSIIMGYDVLPNDFILEIYAESRMTSIYFVS